MIIRVLVALAIGLSPAAAAAASAEKKFAPRGPALVTCEQVIKSLNERKENVFLIGGWIDGYLTAVNQFTPDTFDIAPWHSTELLVSVVKSNCERNKEAPFFEVVQAMLKLFSQKRLREESERVAVEVGESKTALYKVIIKDMQETLINRGFLQGTADGAFGPKTKTAIEAFQKAEKIPETGFPDQQTLWRLFGPTYQTGQTGQTGG